MVSVILFIVFGVSIVFSSWFVFVVVYDAYTMYHNTANTISKINLTERVLVARDYLIKSFWYHFPKP